MIGIDNIKQEDKIELVKSLNYNIRFS